MRGQRIAKWRRSQVDAFVPQPSPLITGERERIAPPTTVTIHLPIILSSIIAAWAMLALLSSERERQIRLRPPKPVDPTAPADLATSAPSSSPANPVKQIDKAKPAR